jgi:hypothetical protein
MKKTRLITGLVLALSISMAPAIADEPTPVVATKAEMDVVKDATAEALEAAAAAVDAAKLVTEAAEAAKTVAQEALASADAAEAALKKLDSNVKALFADLTRQVTTMANTMAKIAKKLKVKTK